MSDNDPSYIAARELDGVLQKLRNDLCECKTKAEIAEKSADDKPSGTWHWVGAVALAAAAFWLLSMCS